MSASTAAALHLGVAEGEQVGGIVLGVVVRDKDLRVRHAVHTGVAEVVGPAGAGPRLAWGPVLGAAGARVAHQHPRQVHVTLASDGVLRAVGALR